ncbi:hypothetical protein [Deinococcus sp. Marseille-Q6407]|uniref:hypothetical protein n=1 Tax=Deinococcus sp. Marseille-Q6407 TaxID=2969223 RepID=UPI0021BF1390|nr:hypothetical protein [Deinococcus sp. Marseille-Q6407]
MLCLGSAAQAQDLGSYRQLSSALTAAGTATDGPGALQELDRAEAAYAKLQPELRDPQLRRSVQAALDRARAALARTPAERQAQVSYAQALLRQALYSQTLQDLLKTGWTAEVQSRLQQLTRDFRLNAAETAALEKSGRAGPPEAVAARLQRAAARSVARELEPWGRGVGRSLAQSDAYLRLSRASGWQLHLAELPGTPPAASYNQALNRLAQGDLDGAEQPVRQLYAAALHTAQQLGHTLDTLPAPAQPAAQASQPAAPASASSASPASTVPVAPATQAAPSTPAPAQPSPTNAVPVTSSTATSGASVTIVPTQPASPAASGTATAPSVSSPKEAADPVYTALGRALAAVMAGDQDQAQVQLQAAAQAVEQLPPAWRGEATTQLAGRLRELAGHSRLEASDIDTQLAGLQNIERQVAQGSRVTETSPLQHLMNRYWNGQIQAAAFLLLTLLLPAPFYFKFRALGHQKGEWALIVTGIGMLAVPPFVEGVLVIASGLGDLLGSPLLQAATTLGVRQSPLGHFLWWLFSLFGVLLMTAGFSQLNRNRVRLAQVRENWHRSRTFSDAGPLKQSPAQPSETPDAHNSWSGWARSLGKIKPGRTSRPRDKSGS